MNLYIYIYAELLYIHVNEIIVFFFFCCFFVVVVVVFLLK